MLTMSGCGTSALDEQLTGPSIIPMQARGESAPLRVAIPGVPKNFDPARFTVVEEFQIGFALFDGLVWVDHTLTPQPMLAEEWESSRDLSQWTFKLREDVLFHHGTALTAGDVVHTFDRILDPRTNSSFRSTLSFLEKVEAVDEYTVRFVLKTPSAELPVLLGAPQARVVAHDYDSATLNDQPSGTGPYQFVKNLPGDRVQLVRNSTYWQDGSPLLEEVEFIFFPYSQQSNLLQQGSIDIMMQVGMNDADSLAANPELITNEIHGGAYQSIVLRSTTKPFMDRRVREALKYCMDRQTFQHNYLYQRGEAGNDHPVASISAFHADLPLRTYDPDKARSLLAAAGYAKGISLDLITSTVRPGMFELATAFKAMAKPAGVNIEVILVPPQVYWSDYAGRVPFHTGNWGFRPSIDETFMVAYHSLSKGNESRWYNATFDSLVDQARGEPDQAMRRDLYHQAQQLVMEDGGVIIPYFLPTIMAHRADVKGITAHPTGWLDLRHTYFG